MILKNNNAKKVTCELWKQTFAHHHLKRRSHFALLLRLTLNSLDKYATLIFIRVLRLIQIFCQYCIGVPVSSVVWCYEMHQMFRWLLKDIQNDYRSHCSHIKIYILKAHYDSSVFYLCCSTVLTRLLITLPFFFSPETLTIFSCPAQKYIFSYLYNWIHIINICNTRGNVCSLAGLLEYILHEIKGDTLSWTKELLCNQPELSVLTWGPP